MICTCFSAPGVHLLRSFCVVSIYVFSVRFTQTMVFVYLEDVDNTVLAQGKNGIRGTLYFFWHQFSKSLLSAGPAILLNDRWTGTPTFCSPKSSSEVAITTCWNIISLSWISLYFYYFPLTIMGNPAAVDWTLPPAGKKGREDPLIFLVVQQYDMVYWCKATFGLYLGYLNLHRNSLRNLDLPTRVHLPNINVYNYMPISSEKSKVSLTTCTYDKCCSSKSVLSSTQERPTFFTKSLEYGTFCGLSGLIIMKTPQPLRRKGKILSHMVLFMMPRRKSRKFGTWE